MRKKIAVVCGYIGIGGVETALFRFLEAIDQERFEVTLFTQTSGSILDSQLPPGIQVWPISKQLEDSKALLLNDLKHFRLFSVIKGLLLRILLRSGKTKYYKLLLTQMIQPNIPQHFDVGVAYKLNFDDTAFLLGRISADKKCGFLHATVENSKEQRSIYHNLKPISKIFCVSEATKARIEYLFPFLAKKTVIFHNLVDTKRILTMARSPIEGSMKKPSVVTVGRLSSEKGQDMVPHAVRLLLNKGHDVYWYLVGDGPLREKIEQEISKHQVSDHVLLLGMKENPYPYIKCCDIYAQTSHTEGYCTTTVEARVLTKPVVTTDAPGMREQFISGENGLIVDAMTPEALAEGIATLLDSPELREKFRQALEKESFDANEMHLLYDLIEG